MSCTHLMVQRLRSTLRHVVPVVAIAIFCAVVLVPVSASAQEVWGPPDDPYVPEDRSDLSSSTGDDDDGGQKAGIPQTIDSVNISSIDPSDFPEICTYVEVLDENGDPIPNLDLDSFCVFQDEQKIDSFSVVELQDECVTSIALVLDVSGSMLYSGKIDSLKSAAHQFVDQMDTFDRVALVTFSSCFNVLQPFTSNKTLLHSQISTLNASGRTAALDGIWAGVDLTKAEVGSRAVIALSDGMENNSGSCPGYSDGLLDGFTDDSLAITNLALNSGVPIYTIALGGTFDPQYLQGLAYGSGGDYYFAPSGSDIAAIYTDIKYRVCSRYLICYQSPDTLLNGDCHNVRICRLDPSGLCQPCDTATYCEPVPPRITVDIDCQPWDQDMWFCATVTDTDTPAESLTVKLFYRNDNNIFNEVVMTLQSGDQFCTTIPSSFFPCGGDPVEFYVTAFDGISAVSYPTNAPGQTDFIEVCPNSPPVCEVPNDTTISLCGQGEVCLPVGCSDPDGNLMDGYPQISGPGSLVNGDWCYTPTGDETVNVLVTCVDSCGASCESEFSVTFEVNEPPVCGFNWNDTTIFQCEPQEICIPYFRNDPDGNIDSCNVTIGGDTKACPPDVFCYTPKGNETVTFTIRCWDDCGEMCESSITVTFDINEAPLCNVPNDTTIFQCEPTEVCWPHFPTDPDNNLDYCEWWIAGDPDKSSSTESLCYTPKESESVDIVINCVDDCGDVCQDTFTATFILNEPPRCGPGYDTTIALCSSEEVCLPVGCDDANLHSGPTLISGPGSIVNGEWCYTPADDETVDFVYECLDSCGVACTTRSVVDFSVNQPPMCDLPNDTLIFQCEPTEVCWEFSFNDPDGNLDSCIVYDIASPDKGLGGSLCITPPGDTTYSFVLECWDACGEYCTDTFTVTFDVNEEPVCGVPDDTTIYLCQSTEVCLDYFPTDLDGNLQGCEQWSSVDPVRKSADVGYAFCYTPTKTEQVIFYAACIDDCGEQCIDSTIVNFILNDDPVCLNNYDTTITLCSSEEICLPVGCRDDNLASGPTLVSGPGSIVDGFWCYTPTEDETVEFAYNCVDSCGVECSGGGVIDFEINEAPVCSALVSLGPPNCTPPVHVISWMSTDPDGDSLTCENTNPNATLGDGVWSYNPVPGEQVIDTIRCTDPCGEFCEIYIDITFPNPQPPVCDLPGDTVVSLCEFGSEICLPATATGGATCEVTSGPGSVENGLWCFTPAEPGEYDVTIECRTECDTCSGSFTVTVEGNSPPVVECSLEVTNHWAVLPVMGDQSPPPYFLRLDGFLDGDPSHEVIWSPIKIWWVEYGDSAHMYGTMEIVEFNGNPVAGGNYEQTWALNAWFDKTTGPNADYVYYQLRSVDSPEMWNVDAPSDVGYLWHYGDPFQVGDGANDKNDHYGASGWLNFVHDSAGTVYGDSTVHWAASDFLLDLIPCFTFCEAEEFCLDYAASDPDGDSLVIFSNLGDPDTGEVCFLPDTSGIYTFIIGAIDECQETVADTCVFCIEINEPPVITCPQDIRVACDQFAYDTGEPTVSDENPATVEVTRETDSIPGDCPQEWTLAISWIATDECGLADTCIQNIYHYDDTPPEIACDDCVEEEEKNFSIVEPLVETKNGDVCPTSATSGNFEIRFDSVTYNNPAGTSSWYYSLKWNGTSPELSHFTIGLCGFIDDGNIVSSTPPHTVVEPDGSTGVYGIKWDSGEPVIETFPANQWVPFSFTVDKQYEVAPSSIVPKAGPQQDIVTLCGVSCDERDPCVVRIPCDSALYLTPPYVEDNCDPEPSIVIVSRDSTQGECPQSYFLTVIWEATDACGNSSTCERKYEVYDDEPPTIECPPDTVISCNEIDKDGEDILGGGRPLGDPIVIDNCDPEPIYESDFEVVSEDPCSTVIKYSFWAYDACGNYSDTCYQYVSVVDTAAPVITCPPDTMIACDEFDIGPEDFKGSTIPQWPYGEPGVDDDCDAEPNKVLASMETVSDDPCSTVIKIGYLAWDRCANYSDTCFQYVTVVDTVAPVVTCPADTSIDCTLDINGQFGWATAEDNCDPEPRVNLVRMDTVFADIGQGCDYTIRRWFSATDTCGNESEECYQAITVVDTTAPVCNLPSDTSFFLCESDEICLSLSASDRCDEDVECRVVDSYGAVVGDQWCFTPDTSGVYPVIIVCEDDCGNQCRGEFTVTVRVNRPPVVEAPADTSYFLCNRGDTICVGPFPESDPDGNQEYNHVPFGWMDPPFVCFVPDTAGVYEVICCTVDSCGAEACDTAYVTVNFNTPPECHPPNDTTIFLCEPEEICLPYSCSDIDGNLMIVDPFKTGDLEKDTFWCYVPKRNETLKLTVLCVDSCGAECRTEFLVTFVLNEAPTCEVPNDTTIFLCDTNEVSLPVSGFDVNENFLDCRLLFGPGAIENGYWTYTPQGEDSSVVVVECIDSCEASCVDTFVVQWDYNEPPICEFEEFSPPQCVPEQVVVPIGSTDPEGGPVTCEVVSGPGELDGNLWQWEPIPGTDTSVVIRCTDTCGAYCELSFRVFIPEPQPPICQVPVEDQEFFFCEPKPISIPITAISNVDGPVTCEVVDGPGEINDTLWTYLPKGTESFDVTVRCTDVCGAFCEETFHVDVTVNEAPVCNLPQDRDFFQCTPTTVQMPFTVSDPDGNFAFCEIWSGPGEILGNNWVYTPQGSETVVVTIRCWDECEEYCEGTFTVRFDIDEDPICNVPNDTLITQCQPTKVMLPVAADFFRPDEDGGNVGDIGGTNQPSRKSTDPKRGTRYGKRSYDPRDERNSNFAAGGGGEEFCEIISGPGILADGYWVYTPAGDEVVTVAIRCTDRCGFTCEDEFTVTFDVNEPPQCTFQEPGPAQCIPPQVVVPFESTDPDGDPLDCELIEGEGTLGDGFWQYTPIGGESFDVVIRCTDTCGAFCEIEFTYTAPNPQPPVCVVPTENVEVFLCGPDVVSAPVSSTGGEGEVVCEVISGKGSISNGQWSFNATKSESFDVVVECTDICGNSCQSSFFVDITVNSAPVCNIPNDQFLWDCEEVDISLPVSGTDVDGQEVVCTVVSGPGQIVNGNYVWSTTQQGVYNVTVACFDECEAYCEETFTLNVDINDAPVCNISDQTFSGCDILSASVPINPTDEDGNLRRCRLLSGPGTLVDGNWVFNTTITGQYDVTIECSDSCGAVSTCTFTATFEANSAPVCNFGDTLITVCGPETDVHLPLDVFDPDDNFIGCTLISGPGSIVGNEWVYHLLEDLPVDLVIRCEDECGMFCEKSFTVSFEYGDVNPCDFMVEDTVYTCGPGEFCLDIPPGCDATFGQGVQGTVDGIDLCFLATEEGRYWANIECTDDCGNTCSDTAYFQVRFDPTLPECGPGAVSTKDGSRTTVQSAGFDPCDCPVRGDIDGDGELTSADLSLLGNFLNKGALTVRGTEHCPLETRADVNCDGKVDMSDHEDLQLYLYMNGAEPCSDCTGR